MYYILGVSSSSPYTEVMMTDGRTYTMVATRTSKYLTNFVRLRVSGREAMDLAVKAFLDRFERDERLSGDYTFSLLPVDF